MRLFETLDPSVQEDLVAASDLAFTTAIYRYPAIQKTGRDDATLEDVVAGLQATPRGQTLAKHTYVATEQRHAHLVAGLKTAAVLLKKPSLTLYARTLRAANLKKAA